MKTNRLFSLIPLLAISCFAVACTNKDNNYLQHIAKGSGFVHLVDAKIVFSYTNVTGFDSSGPLYYVLDYSEVEETKRFENPTSKDRVLKDGRDSSFEAIVEKFINNDINDSYETFKDEYKINWEKPYRFYTSYEEYIGTALIYYQDCNYIFALSYKM